MMTFDNAISDDKAVQPLARAVQAFAARFGHLPCWAASAPGRVNLIGDHTDYQEGFVLPMAIDRRTVVVAGPADAGKGSRVVALDLQREAEIRFGEVNKPVERAAVDSFVNYVLGVVAGFRKASHAVGEMNVVIASNVPVGSGLSSSAALSVATATMLEAACGCALGAEAKASLCQRAEHVFGGTPCGIMDVLVSASARGGQAMLIDCRSLERRHVGMRLETGEGETGGQLRLLVVDTGVRRMLNDGGYAERRERCERVAQVLGVRSLRDATMSMLSIAGLEEAEHRAASHVILENARTSLASGYLMLRDYEAFGQLMFDSHRSLRDLFGVSCAELDVVVRAARTCRRTLMPRLGGEDDAGRVTEGVLGARMTGAGFGGCAVVLCDASAVDRVKQCVDEQFEERFGRRPVIFDVTAGEGARVELLKPA